MVVVVLEVASFTIMTYELRSTLLARWQHISKKSVA